MTQLANTFEGGSDETTITTGNSGGGSGDAFYNINLDAGGGTAVFDNARAAHGTYSARLNNGTNPSGSTYVEWDDSSYGDLTTHYGRAYFYFSTIQSTARIILFRFASLIFLELVTGGSGNFRIRDNTAFTANSTNTVPTGQWVRFEWKLVHSATVGEFTVRYYADAESSTPTETLSITNGDTGTSGDYVWFGPILSAVNQTLWVDSLIVGATDWPGPAVSPTPATVVAVPTGYRVAAEPGIFTAAVAVTVNAPPAILRFRARPGSVTPPLAPPAPPPPAPISEEDLIRSPALLVTAGLELLDADDHLIGDISDWLEPAGSSVTRNNLAVIHGSCHLNIAQDLNWQSQRLRPYVTITDLTTGIALTWPLGVYLPETPRRTAGESPQMFTVEGYDKLVVLNTPIGATYSLDAATPYVAAVETLIEAAGETAYHIDQTAATKTLASSQMWLIDEQHTYLSVINELLAAVGYRALWVDRTGVYRSVPYTAPSARSVTWRYDTAHPATIMRPGTIAESDLFTVPNRWVFIRDDPTDELPAPGNGLYIVSNQSDGPGSIDQRAGRVISRIVRLEAADQTTLETRGDALVEADRQPAVTLDWSTSPNPLHWHADTIKVTSAELGITNALFSEQSWSFPLDGSDMTHHARKVVA